MVLHPNAPGPSPEAREQRAATPAGFEWAPRSPISIDTIDSSGSAVAIDEMLPLPQGGGARGVATPPEPRAPRHQSRPRHFVRLCLLAAGLVLLAAGLVGGAGRAATANLDLAAMVRSLGPFAAAVDRNLVALFTPVAVRLVPGASRDPLPVRTRQEAVVAAPVAPAVPMGRLNVNAVPWAEISVDGRRIGRTPLEGLSISAGSHRITFYHPGFGAHHTVTVVTANETAHAVMHFTASN